MDPSLLSGLGMMSSGGGAGGGGLLAQIIQRMQGGAAPSVPPDGSMQPTIGPGTDPAAAAPYSPKLGLPKGGLLGIMQGGQPNGLAGLLQHFLKPAAPAAAPMGGMPQAAGMLPGMPGSPMEGPVAPQPQLPMNIDPMNQF